MYNGRIVDILILVGLVLNFFWMDVIYFFLFCVLNVLFDYLFELFVFYFVEFKCFVCFIWFFILKCCYIYVFDELMIYLLVLVVLVKSWEGVLLVYICIGWELFVDEDKYFVKKMWEEDGVRVRLEEYEGMLYCFGLIFLGLKEVRRCFLGWGGFIKEVVEGSGERGSRFLIVRVGMLEEVERKGEEVSWMRGEVVRRRMEGMLRGGLEVVVKL